MDQKEYSKKQKYITHQLVKAREESFLTQKQVGETGIVSQSEISKIENGQRNIDFITLIELTKLYNKDIAFFLPKP